MTDFSQYKHCRLCPRECGVNRLAGERGFCGMDGRLYAARAALHYWEEPCLSGEAALADFSSTGITANGNEPTTRGSGTVFFSGCTLRCVYCQNHAISRGEAGLEITVDRLSDIFLELQQKGAYNINLVTPTHFLPHIVPALEKAKAEGLVLPVVYNTSGYELPEQLRRLEGLVDVWLPDIKYKSPDLARRYSAAPDYFERAAAALDEMVRQTGEPMFDQEDMMTRGVIVRHLILPGQTEDSKAVVRWLWERYGDAIWISLMNQYTPMPGIEAPFPELGRKLTAAEYDDLVDYAMELGVENGFLQEGGTASESFIPPFDGEGIMTKP